MSTVESVIYQLKVALQGISPMIWRRLLVCGDNTIADLHYIIQIAMGWSDDPLHQFRIHGKRYGIARMGGVSFRNDVESTINQVVSKRMVKKQQMRWSQQGAHFLLQVRTRVLNDELREIFQQWYPRSVQQGQPLKKTA